MELHNWKFRLYVIYAAVADSVDFIERIIKSNGGSDIFISAFQFRNRELIFWPILCRCVINQTVMSDNSAALLTQFEIWTQKLYSIDV